MANSLGLIFGTVIVSGVVVLCLIICLAASVKIGMPCPRCPCGHFSELCMGENTYGFGGKLVYWYSCMYCRRESEKMINKEAARKSWENKFGKLNECC